MSRIPLLNEIHQCQVCEPNLPFPAKPILQISQTADILIIGQAPGIKAHDAGRPFTDASGKRLRDWMKIDETEFYDPSKVAIMPMGFCYPGKGKSGDLAPRKECAPRWHHLLLANMPNLQTILLIGQYSQQYYLVDSPFLNRYSSLSERVRHTQHAPQPFVCLPHPSPRNQIWLNKNPWFDKETLPFLQHTLQSRSQS